MDNKATQNITRSSANKRAQLLNQYLSNPQQKSYFVAAVSIIFTIIFLAVGVVPAYQSIVARSTQNQKIDEAISKMQKRLSDFELLITQNNEKTDVVNYLNTVFPNEIDQEEINRIFFNKAQQSSVTIRSVSYTESQRRLPLITQFGTIPQVQSVGVSIVLEGSREGVLQFISSLEQSRRIFNLTNTSISRKTGDNLDQSGLAREYDAVLNLEYFYWRDVIVN